MKKMVLKLDLHNDKEKQKAMKMVCSLSGIDSIAMDMKEKKLTVVGVIDLILLVDKLRKSWHTEILTVGPAKEPENKKEEGKKDDGKKDDDRKKEEEEEENKEEEQIAEFFKFYNNRGYNPHMAPCYYYVPSAEENPNACVIS